MKISFLVSLVLALSVSNAFAAENPRCDTKALSQLPFAGGKGTSESPYGICSFQQLEQMEQQPKASYQLWADIEAGAARPLFSREKPFLGSLDGMGRTISNLSLQRPNEDYVALIRTCSGCTVKNLDLNAVQIRGRNYIGALIADYQVETDATHAPGMPRIADVSVKGTVTGLMYAGGVFGTVYNVDRVLSDQDFFKNGVKFEGTVTLTAFPAQGSWISGGYDYD